MVNTDLARSVEKIFEEFRIDARKFLATLRCLCRNSLQFYWLLLFNWLRSHLGLLRDFLRGSFLFCLLLRNSWPRFGCFARLLDLRNFVIQRRIDDHHADGFLGLHRKFDGNRLVRSQVLLFLKRRRSCLARRDCLTGIDLVNLLFQRSFRRDLFAGDDCIAHMMQFVDAQLQQLIDLDGTRNAAVIESDQQCLEFVAEIAHRRDARHACAALQRMQVALELFDVLAIVFVLGPVHQSLVSRLQQFGSFFGKNCGNLCIVFRLCRDGGGRRFGRFDCSFHRNIGDRRRLDRIGQIIDVFDQDEEVGAVAVSLIYVSYDRTDGFRGRAKCVDA